jgi:hypothetical protein
MNMSISIKRLKYLAVIFIAALCVTAAVFTVKTYAYADGDRIPAYDDVSDLTDEEIAAREAAFLADAKKSFVSGGVSGGCGGGGTAAFAALLGGAVLLLSFKKR